MARCTALGLDDRVFMLEWPGDFDVAFGADNVFLRRKALQLLAKGPVGLVTVRTQDQTFDYLVTERGGELCALLFMALKAEIRLSDREKMFRFVEAVNEMAADAAYIAAAVSRTLKDGVLAGVAVQTQIIHLFRSSIRRIEDL